MKSIFSFQGSISRSQFWLGMLAGVTCMMVLGLFGGGFLGSQIGGPSMVLLLAVVGTAAGGAIAAFLTR